MKFRVKVVFLARLLQPQVVPRSGSRRRSRQRFTAECAGIRAAFPGPKLLEKTRRSNAIERLHEEFNRRIKTQTLPCRRHTPSILPLREQLHSKFLRAALRHRQKLEHEENGELAIDWYEKVLEIGPLAEEVYCRQMSYLLNLGRSAEALTVYKRCRRILQSLLRTEPASETRALCQKPYAGHIFESPRVIAAQSCPAVSWPPCQRWRAGSSRLRDHGTAPACTRGRGATRADKCCGTPCHCIHPSRIR